MRGAKVTVIDNHGDITLGYKGRTLDYKTYDKANRPTPIIGSKNLDKAIARKVSKPKANHPWKCFTFGAKSAALTS